MHFAPRTEPGFFSGHLLFLINLLVRHLMTFRPVLLLPFPDASFYSPLPLQDPSDQYRNLHLYPSRQSQGHPGLRLTCTTKGANKLTPPGFYGSSEAYRIKLLSQSLNLIAGQSDTRSTELLKRKEKYVRASTALYVDA
jgi:hypothetical protein